MFNIGSMHGFNLFFTVKKLEYSLISKYLYNLGENIMANKTPLPLEVNVESVKRPKIHHLFIIELGGGGCQNIPFLCFV